MTKWHDDIENRIKKEFENEYKVRVSHEEDIDLPLSADGVRTPPEKSLYNPDITIQEIDNGNILSIIEVVETSPNRPVGYVGTPVIANICIGIMMDTRVQNKDVKPQLIFINKEPITNEEINKYNKLKSCIKLIELYSIRLNHLRKPIILCKEKNMLEEIQRTLH